MRDEKSGNLFAQYDGGIPIGYYDEHTNKVHIYNHLDIKLKTHYVTGSKDEMRVVGFEVWPKSVRKGSHLFRSALDEQPDQELNLDNPDGMTILFSYTLTNTNDDTTTWASRMDQYYNYGKADVWLKEIIFILVVIAVYAFYVHQAVKNSVNHDFAVLQARVNKKSQATISSSQDEDLSGFDQPAIDDNDESIGWRNLANDLFQVP